MGENVTEFGELSLDEVFRPRLISFRKDLESASKMLETFFTRYNYDELSLEDKVRELPPPFLRLSFTDFLSGILSLRINRRTETLRHYMTNMREYEKYNLFLAFAINSYFWMYLRVKGIDPNQHDLKEQIERLKKYMNRSKKIHERKTIMPKIDQGAAKRFVRSGLWTPENSNKSKSDASEPDAEVPMKRKRSDSEG